MYHNHLINIGFTPKEAAIYLALLEIGEANNSQIAMKAKINRVTSYDILEKLIEKVAVTTVIKNKVKYYNAIEPELIFSANEKNLQEFKNILPALHSIQSHHAKPKVQFFTGMKGIKKTYSDNLSSKTEILNFSNSSSIRKYWPKYDEEYVKKRVANKIYLRGIIPDDTEGLATQAKDKKNHRELRLVSHQDFHFTNEINIYENKVSIISFGNEPIGIIIESEEIAQTQRDIFKMAWSFAKIHQSKSEKKNLNT